MTTDTQISIALLIALVTLVTNIINFYKVQKKDIKSDNEVLIELKVKLDSVGRDISDIKSETKYMDKHINDLTEEQAVMKNDIKSLWRSVDQLNDFRKSKSDKDN